MIFSLRILDQGRAIMKGAKLVSAAPELGTSTHLTTQLFKQPACLERVPTELNRNAL